jgi:hypothetical protein
VSAEYSSYLQGVRNRLERDGFETQESVRLGGLTADMLAFKDREFAPNRSTLCSVTYFPQADVESLNNYTKVIHDKGFEHQHQIVKGEHGERIPRSNLYVFPVLVSPKFDNSVKKHVLSWNGYGFQAGTNFARVVHEDVKHPVLAELETKSIYHFVKWTFVAYVPMRSAKKFAVKHFSFET